MIVHIKRVICDESSVCRLSSARAEGEKHKLPRQYIPLPQRKISNLKHYITLKNRKSKPIPSPVDEITFHKQF